MGTASFDDFCKAWPMRSADERAEAEKAFAGLPTWALADAVAAAPGMRRHIAEYDAAKLEHGITPQRFLKSPFLRALGLKLAEKA